jgi:predicted ester cyclase
MSIEEQNKDIVYHFYELLNRKEIDTAYDYFAPEFVFHGAIGEVNREQLKQFDTMASRAFSDSICTVNDIIAEKDRVAFRISWTGTHKGEFMGIAPTGKNFKMQNTYIVRIRDNKYVEQWGTTEIPLMMQQLGAIPA